MPGVGGRGGSWMLVAKFSRAARYVTYILFDGLLPVPPQGHAAAGSREEAGGDRGGGRPHQVGQHEEANSGTFFRFLFN